LSQYESSRAEQLFVTVNCGPRSETFFENADYVHYKGSVTGYPPENIVRKPPNFNRKDEKEYGQQDLHPLITTPKSTDSIGYHARAIC
jgi:hypothetical protein